MLPQDEDDIPGLKVVLIGNTGVGKTCLVNRWIADLFEKLTPSTVGAANSMHRMKIKDTLVDIFLWDTAGQEQYQTLMPLYVRQVCCAILTISIDNKDSFEMIPNWINVVKTNCENMPPLVLVVNKIDLEDSLSDFATCVNEKYPDTFASIFYASALTGGNVTPIFQTSAELAFDFYQKMKEKPQDTAIKVVKSSNIGGCC